MNRCYGLGAPTHDKRNFELLDTPLEIDGATLRAVPSRVGQWSYLDYPGAKILMRNETVIERAFRLRACEKEPWSAAWLDTLGPGDLLFNIGACVGSYALIAAHRGARVVAVEASPVNAARLAENVAANRLGDLVTLLLGVCGPTVEPYGTWQANPIAGAADIKIGNPHPKGIMLPGLTLDELTEIYGQPSHLLIDVDGGELDVLRGGAEALKGVQDVMIEVSRDQCIENGCSKALSDSGLTLHDVWGERNGAPIEGVTYGRYRRVT